MIEFEKLSRKGKYLYFGEQMIVELRGDLRARKWIKAVIVDGMWFSDNMGSFQYKHKYGTDLMCFLLRLFDKYLIQICDSCTEEVCGRYYLEESDIEDCEKELRKLTNKKHE